MTKGRNSKCGEVTSGHKAVWIGCLKYCLKPYIFLKKTQVDSLQSYSSASFTWFLFCALSFPLSRPLLLSYFYPLLLLSLLFSFSLAPLILPSFSHSISSALLLLLSYPAISPCSLLLSFSCFFLLLNFFCSTSTPLFSWFLSTVLLLLFLPAISLCSLLLSFSCFFLLLTLFCPTSQARRKGGVEGSNGSFWFLFGGAGRAKVPFLKCNRILY